MRNKLMEQKKTSEERGQFNLDYEETVLLKSRFDKIKKKLDTIIENVDNTLNRRGKSLSSIDEDRLVEIKKIAKEAKK